MVEAWRLLREKNNEPYTLFHGVNGSRRLDVGTVLRAVERPVTNPGKKTGTVFLSGWHILPSLEECQDYLKRFTRRDDLVICRVLVARLRDKPNSRVKLSRYMKIDPSDWEQRVRLH